MNNLKIRHCVYQLTFCKTAIILAIVFLTVMIIFIYDKWTTLAAFQGVLPLYLKENFDISCAKNYELLRTNCQWHFLNYTPSLWEREWFDNIDQYQKNVCETLLNSDNLNKISLAVARLIQLQKFGRTRTVSENHKADILFSTMYYRQECFDSETGKSFGVAEISHLIESLVGLLRDPLTICRRVNPSLLPSSLYNGAVVQSKRFLLLSIAAPVYVYSLAQNSDNTFNINITSDGEHNNVLPWMYQRLKINLSNRIVNTNNVKNILLDLGSSYFGHWHGDSSAAAGRWFYENYKRFGVKFDRIIAFEFAPLNPKSAWDQLPDDVFPIYTLINVGCAESGKFNPLITLQALAKPQDHVVLKLDIDNPTIENALINQILNDSNIYSLIDEMFFENHITVSEMVRYWGRPPGTLKDSYVLFTKLRQLGIRMHSWP